MFDHVQLLKHQATLRYYIAVSFTERWLINRHQIMSRQTFQPPPQHVLMLRFHQFIDRSRGRGKPNAPLLPAGDHTRALSKCVFPVPLSPMNITGSARAI